MADRNGEALSAAYAGVQASCHEADITDELAVTQAIAALARAMGGIDGLVNAADIMDKGSILDMPVARWRQQIGVNRIGTYLVCRACVGWMLEKPQATIVNIAWAARLLPNAPGLSAYAAPKAE